MYYTQFHGNIFLKYKCKWGCCKSFHNHNHSLSFTQSLYWNKLLRIKHCTNMYTVRSTVVTVCTCIQIGVHVHCTSITPVYTCIIFIHFIYMYYILIKIIVILDTFIRICVVYLCTVYLLLGLQYIQPSWTLQLL